MSSICKPTTLSTGPLFVTERLPLAVFLHATCRLAFAGCRLGHGHGKVAFLFHDPDYEGSQVELEFDQGASVAATALFASQKFLRRRMSETIENRRIEETYAYPQASN
jgi:hypothetical protein